MVKVLAVSSVWHAGSRQSRILFSDETVLMMETAPNNHMNCKGNKRDYVDSDVHDECRMPKLGSD